MSGQHVNAAWQTRLRTTPIAPALTLTTEGLILGAGTVLVAATRRLSSLQGQEPRVLALLAASYGRPIGPSVLGEIERAAKAWREGDDCLAHIHLAHTGLHPLGDAQAAAYRLFLADGALCAGASFRDDGRVQGTGYDDPLAASKATVVPVWSPVVREWWAESGRQIEASDGHPLRWYFADLAVALFARKMFDSDTDGGRQRIEVVFLPWSKRGQ